MLIYKTTKKVPLSKKKSTRKIKRQKQALNLSDDVIFPDIISQFS